MQMDKKTVVLVDEQSVKQVTKDRKNISIGWLLLVSFVMSVASGFALHLLFGAQDISAQSAHTHLTSKIDASQIIEWEPATVELPKVDPKLIVPVENIAAVGNATVALEKEEQLMAQVDATTDRNPALTDAEMAQLDKTNAQREQETLSNLVKRQEAQVAKKSSFIIASKEFAAANPTVQVDYTCTGVNDDVVINAAIENLSRPTAQVPKRTITLTTGTFNMNGPVFITGDLIFKGSGRSTTILRLVNNALPFAKAGFFRAFYVNNFEIRDLTADGNKQNQIKDKEHQYGRFGTYYEACNNTITDNLRITNWAGYGFDPHGTGETTIYGTDMEVSNCISDNNDWDGYTIDKNLRAYVRNNVAYNNGRHGINIVTGTYECEVSGNNVYDNGYYYYTGARGNGIVVQNNQEYGTRNVQVFNNKVTNNRGRGILLDDVKDITVRDNDISSVSSCILVQNTVGTMLARNKCADGKFIVISGINTGLMVEEQSNIQCSYT
jgi:parallel beta-helix repeat protein